LRASNKSLCRAALVLASCFFGLAGCNSEGGPTAPLNPQQENGRRIFQANCAQCHDPYSTKPRTGPGLKHLFRGQYLPSGAPANDDRVRATIEMGRVNMPAFRNILDDQQINDLLAFLHTL
jgi:mono/diheme cytochrome c family protein